MQIIKKNSNIFIFCFNPLNYSQEHIPETDEITSNLIWDEEIQRFNYTTNESGVPI